MKMHLLSSVSFLVLAAASPAIAAPRAPVMPVVPTYNWTGWYVGGNIGYSWGNADSNYNEPAFACCGVTGLPTSFSTSQKLDGVIGGAQVGYNWQANATWVLGLEADIQGSGERGSTSYSNPYSFAISDCDGLCIGHGTLSQTQQAKILWFGTVRGRAGVLVNPTTLLYATGGLAYGRISESGTVSDTACTPSPTVACMWSYGNSATNVGWALGAGIEGAIPNTRNWTWKVEYLHIDLGTVSGNGFDTDFGGPYTFSTRVTDNIFRVGFNYGFQ
jgi:outer membrane immunogenic protein